MAELPILMGWLHDASDSLAADCTEQYSTVLSNNKRRGVFFGPPSYFDMHHMLLAC